MAPSDDRHHDQEDSKQRHDPSNPFVTFKRFVDEQVDSMMERAFGSNPFLFSPPVSHKAFQKEFEAMQKEVREAMGLESSPPRSEDDTDSRQVNDENWQDCPYSEAKEDLSEQDHKDLRSFLGFGLVDMMLPWASRRHAADEQSEERDPCNTKELYSSRICQLLRLMEHGPTLNKPSGWFLDKHDHEKGTEDKREEVNGQEWGIWDKNDRHPGESNPSTVQGDEEQKIDEIVDCVRRSLSDADVFELAEELSEIPSLAKLLSPSSELSPANHPPPPTHIPNSKPQRPSILSTLTTTETTTLPDGSVQTKTVLKRRFSDGREESSESQRTDHAPPSLQGLGRFTQARQDHGRAKEEERKIQPRKGWFWR